MGILEYLQQLSDPVERRDKEALLAEAEAVAAEKAKPNEGAVELVALLRSHGIPMAVITRNSEKSVERCLSILPGIDSKDLALIVTRDLDLSPKPLPDGVLHAVAELGVEPRETLLIGDHAYDVDAGRGAGIITMFLENDPVAPASGTGADFAVPDLHEAARIIRYGLPLPTGKLPPALLEESIGLISTDDPNVLVSARMGEDAAIVDVVSAEVLVLASDPITLASDSIARYAVLANANDVATTGATPRWLLTTLLFPPGSTASEVAALVRDIQHACVSAGVSLCGGHTEVTDAVSRPLVVGTMGGIAALSQVLDKRDMREGDRLLITKGVAVEGTGLIAREFAERLAAGGMGADEIDECAAFLEKMSILEEARLAASFSGVTALHDVTEGGLATAVSELGAAGGRRLRVDMDAIPVYPQTRRVCEVMGIDPLGLIGSGSLLITCHPRQTGSLMEVLTAAHVEVTEIGEVLTEGRGIEAHRSGHPAEWPRFERDEASRVIR